MFTYLVLLDTGSMLGKHWTMTYILNFETGSPYAAHVAQP